MFNKLSACRFSGTVYVGANPYDFLTFMEHKTVKLQNINEKHLI